MRLRCPTTTAAGAASAEAAADSFTARLIEVRETKMIAAVRMMVTQVMARMRESIEFTCSTVKRGPSPCAATSSWRPIRNDSPKVM